MAYANTGAGIDQACGSEHEISMIPEDRLHQIAQRFEYLEAAMADGGGDISELAREYASLRPVMTRSRHGSNCRRIWTRQSRC